jgi:signal transduction histidine kinase
LKPRKPLIFGVDMSQDVNNKARETAEDLIANVAHDLRSPLNITYHLVEILQRNVLGPLNAQQHDALNTMKDNIFAGLDLSEKILNARNLDNHSVVLSLEPMSINQFLEKCSTNNQILAGKKSIEIIFDPGDDVELNLDPLRMRQIINNLLQNAIKFSNSRKKITIKTIKSNNEFKISIQDEGQGIKEDELPRIFEKFKQVSTKSTAGEKGLGIGLSIVKDLIELHNGTIDVQSTFSEGSVFTITLPIT